MRHSHITDGLQETASLYAVGALPKGERVEFVRHIEDENCDVCRTEANEFEAVASLLALSVPFEAPSPALKVRLTEQARNAVPPRENRKKSLHWIFDFAAGLTILAAFVVIAASTQANRELRNLTFVLTSRINQLEAQSQQQQALYARLTASGVRVVDLAGQGANPAASGRIFWDQQQRRWLFYIHGLPPAPSDKAYQLWFVPYAGNPVSASVFNTEPDGAAVIEVNLPENLAALKAAAVTTEPAGGLPQPSGAFALLGEIR